MTDPPPAAGDVVPDPPPPREAVVTAWAALMRAQQTVLAAVEAELKAAGFPPLEWYDALLELSRAEDGALRPGELQARMLLAQYSVSRLTDRLADAGYVTKNRHPADGRGAVVTVTEAGRELLRAMWPVYGAAIERHVGARLTAEEAAALTRLLRKLSGWPGTTSVPAEPL